MEKWEYLEKTTEPRPETAALSVFWPMLLTSSMFGPDFVIVYVSRLTITASTAANMNYVAACKIMGRDWNEALPDRDKRRTFLDTILEDTSFNPDSHVFEVKIIYRTTCSFRIY